MALLDRVTCPEDVGRLTMEQRMQLVDEVRQRIIDVVSRTGGHLASSLGVVELTVAILSVYRPPEDIVVWDVGHQTYAWKLLTGRCDRFDTIRCSGGLSGFPKRSESPCDPFGTGHSSTSVSAALGFSLARDLTGGSGRTVAVIGDGAMTGGMALEGLNHLGHTGTGMLIILNDNEMSISPNVGAISRHLTDLITDPAYNRVKADVWNALGKLPLGERVRKAAHAITASLKRTIVPTDTIFDDFGVRYVGPVPGHDLPTLTGVLQRVSEIPGPVLLHVVSKKGKGYRPAEEDATGYHGVSASRPAGASGRSFTRAFSSAMVSLGEREPRLVAITAAMPDGTGLTEFSERYPERFHDVGIAEQHAVTLAAGMAFGGLRPVAAIYSTFMQRALDQVIHDVALQGAPVVLAMDRAGVVGEDGPTHHGVFDLPMLLPVPGLRIGAPGSCRMLESMLAEAVADDTGPVALRYPRGAEPSNADADREEQEGGGHLLRRGGDLLIVGVGVCSLTALEAASLLSERGIEAAVLDPVWLKPMPAGTIRRLALECGRVLTVEEGAVRGGFGCAVRELLDGTGVPVRSIGVPDGFQPHAPREELLAGMGLDPGGVVRNGEGLCRGEE